MQKQLLDTFSASKYLWTKYASSAKGSITPGRLWTALSLRMMTMIIPVPTALLPQEVLFLSSW